jgi:hypothetical protein
MTKILHHLTNLHILRSDKVLYDSDIYSQRRAARVFQFIPSLLLGANYNLTGGRRWMYEAESRRGRVFPTASVQYLSVKFLNGWVSAHYASPARTDIMTRPPPPGQTLRIEVADTTKG